MPLIAAAIGGVASAGTGLALSKAFGGGDDAPPPIAGFRAGGIKLINQGGLGVIRASTDPARQTLIQQIQQNLRAQGTQVRGTIPRFTEAFGTATTGTRDLLGRVAPGVSGLREARLGELERRRERSLSNLTANLARRRVAGSSFANIEAERAELGFAEEADRIEAESFLEEIDLTSRFQTQLLEQEVAQIDTELSNFLSALQFEGAATQTGLDEQNFLAELASRAATGATGATASLRATQLQLAANEAAGAGEFAGRILGDIDFASAFQDLFSNVSGGGGSDTLGTSIGSDRLQ